MKLGDAVTLRRGNTITIQDAETYRISGIQNYGKGVIVRREVKGSELTMREYQVIEPNQLMWCKVDTKNGAFGITHPEHAGTMASPNMALADINLAKVDPSFLETLFRVQPFADYITNLSSGTTNRKYLTPPQLFTQVELPDWEPAEQRRFVSKLKKIESCGLPHEITHQKTLLTKLKQAILQEAISGKLTADWRAAHSDVEPASQLLKRIQAERARLIAAKKLRPEKPLPKITHAEIPFEIPDGWEWCRLGDVAQHSLGKMLDKGKNKGTEQPYLRNLNVRWYEFNLSDLKTMPFEEHESEKYSVQRSDVLICEGGHGIGRAAVWCSDDTVMFQKALHRVRFIGSFYEPDLFVHFLQWSDMTEHITKFFTGAGIPHFTGASIHELPIPLPPLAEQAAIVSRVEALMAHCRALEAEIAQTRTHAAHLLQAVLKEAFAQSV